MHIAMLLSNAFRPDPRVYKEAQSLSEAGFNITIICWDRRREFPHEEDLSPNIKIIRVQNVSSSYGIGARQILALPLFWHAVSHILNTLKPSLIHCHDFDTLPAGLIWGKWHHKPVVYDAHEYYADLVRPRLRGVFGKALYIMIRLAEKLGARMADAIVTVDEKLAKYHSSLNKCVLVLGHYPPKIMAVTNNPIFTGPELTLLYAGRISRDRGSILYIELLRKLRELSIPARLVLAGTFTPSNEEGIFWQNAHGLENYIEFRAWVPFQQMTALYRSADIGLSILMPEPRYVAAVPIKLFEYMAGGLPVLASDFSSISSIISTARCGVLVDPLSQPAEIAAIIEKWWNDPAIPRLFGENGRQAVLQKYNWENEVSQLTELEHQFMT